MPYYPNPVTDSGAGPLAYSGRSDGGDDDEEESGSRSRSQSGSRNGSVGVMDVVNGKLAAHLANQRRKITDSRSHSEEEYEDARSEFGIHEEDEDNEVDMLVPHDFPYESVGTPTLREADTKREPPLNGFTTISKGNTPQKPALVAVVLNSTPQREAYQLFRSDELDQQGEEEDDVDPIVTSDLLPSPHRRKPPPKVTPIPPPQIPPIKRPLPESTSLNPPKKRGRPVGWRPGSGPYSSKTPKEKKQPSTPSAATREAKRRGRPPRQPSPPPRVVYLRSETTKFNSFICEWEGCPAKLQNVDTLHRHLKIVHGNITNNPKIHQQNPTPTVCKWGTCPSKHPELVLPTREDFINHIERHMTTQKWYMGDGPKNTSHETDYSKIKIIPTRGDANPLPSYLFDPQTGEQVTPSIKDQEFENEKDRKDRMIKLERIKRQMQENAPEQPAYTEEQVRDIEKALKEKRDLKNMYARYREAVVERPREVEKLRRKLEREAGKGKGPETGMPSEADLHRAVGGGPMYGPEWRGNLLGI